MARASLLLAVDDPALLDLLTRVLERRGFAVATAATVRLAIATLERKDVDVIVAAWDAGHRLGGEVYRWALAHRLDLRGQFVFVGADLTEEAEALIAGRCLVIAPDAIEELVRAAEAAARRRERAAQLSSADVAWLDEDRPTLLLAEDDTLQLMVMASLLGDLGFRVTAVESGNAAIAQLELDDVDVIVAEWRMADGAGVELYRWIATAKPWLLDRLIFLTGGDPDEVARGAPDVPVLPKGQDSAALLALLTATARRVRRAS